MKLFAHDLALVRQMYGDAEKVPEMTVRVPKGKDVPAVGEFVRLTNEPGTLRDSTADCMAEVVAVAVVVKPVWSSYKNPRAEREQGSLL